MIIVNRGFISISVLMLAAGVLIAHFFPYLATFIQYLSERHGLPIKLLMILAALPLVGVNLVEERLIWSKIFDIEDLKVLGVSFGYLIGTVIVVFFE